MPRDLDRDWADQRPALIPSDLEFTFMGTTLRRLPEIPLTAFVGLETDTSQQETLAVLEAIRECLDPVSYEAWDKIVGRVGRGSPDDEDYREAIAPRSDMPLGRVMQVWRYLVEASTGRPTERASVSSSGRSSDGTNSTDGSPSPVAAILRPSEPGGSPTLHTRSAGTDR